MAGTVLNYNAFSQKKKNAYSRIRPFSGPKKKDQEKTLYLAKGKLVNIPAPV